MLDPFSGSGTTCVAAEGFGRQAVGIDMSPEYCEVARQRMAKATEDCPFTIHSADFSSTSRPTPPVSTPISTGSVGVAPNQHGRCQYELAKRCPDREDNQASRDDRGAGRICPSRQLPTDQPHYWPPSPPPGLRDHGGCTKGEIGRCQPQHCNFTGSLGGLASLSRTPRLDPAMGDSASWG